MLGTRNGRTPGAVGVLLAAALLLTGCGSDEQPAVFPADHQAALEAAPTTPVTEQEFCETLGDTLPKIEDKSRRTATAAVSKALTTLWDSKEPGRPLDGPALDRLVLGCQGTAHQVLEATGKKSFAELA